MFMWVCLELGACIWLVVLHMHQTADKNQTIQCASLILLHWKVNGTRLRPRCADFSRINCVARKWRLMCLSEGLSFVLAHSHWAQILDCFPTSVSNEQWPFHHWLYIANLFNFHFDKHGRFTCDRLHRSMTTYWKIDPNDIHSLEMQVSSFRF